MKTLVVCFALCVIGIHTMSVDLPKYGLLRGEFDSSKGLTRFLGVPFAQPPVGERRFALPVEVERWTGELDATKQKPACPQGPAMFGVDTLKDDENCLHLNIFVPGQVDPNKKLPVLVHIHDGMFQIGSSADVDGSKIAANDNIVVVTFNYRLGVLGFYGKENYGLHDQNMALKWVKVNIEHFGGASDQITVSGSGSGAFSVGLHVLSNASNSLFQRAVSFGGSPFQTNYIVPPSKSKSSAKAFASVVGCSCCDFDCLRKVDLVKLFEAQKLLSTDGVRFFVSEDDTFFPRSLESLSGDNKTSTVTDFVIGVNSGAGAEFVPSELSNPSDVSHDQFLNVVNDFAKNSYPLISTSFTEMAMLEYGQRSSVVSFYRDAVVGSVRDAQMRLVKAGMNVYGYFCKSSPMDTQNNAMSVSTGSENRALFDDPITGKFDDLVKNFIKTGSPTTTDGKDEFEWPKFDEDQQKILVTGKEADDIASKYPDEMEEHMSFWADLVPNMAKTCDMCDEEDKAGKMEGPILELKQGKVRGESTTLDSGYTFELYRDIPYGKAPLGELRFKPPQPRAGWDGILEPQELPISCPQSNYMLAMIPEKYTEDCLHLDIYVPQSLEQTRTKKLPIMVFMHGGGFGMGSKNIYNGAALTMYDVIVVTINYRLGVLGFMSTEDEFSRGNYGIMDQALAIKWVKMNAGNFGGDPDRITLFGESAGACSVALQALIPSNKGVFHRVIAQSGGSFLGTAVNGAGYRASTLYLKGGRSFQLLDLQQLRHS